MRLLVSVRNDGEVRAALDGGAEIIDVKDPSMGPLGAPDLATVRAVRAAVATPVLMSVAIGDTSESESVIVGRARAVLAAGADFIKLGLHAGIDAGADRILRRLVASAAAIRPAARVVAVGYADRLGAENLTLPDRARAASVHAIMLDTFAKDGKSLLRHVQEDRMCDFVARGRALGLWTGAAGSLGRAEIDRLRRCRPDVVGVRGAVCRGGREGRISTARVRRLAQSIRRQPEPEGTAISHSSPADATAK